MTRILCLLLLIAALAVCAALLPLALPVLIVVGVVQAVLLFFLIWTAMLHGRRSHPAWPVLERFRYAHRGLHDKEHGIPENSLAAFRLAAEHGYGAELDVHLTRDGRLAVIHDDSLLRTAGADVKASQLTAAQLGKYRLESTDEKIPFLEEVLPLFQGKTPLIVELKVEGNAAALAKATCDLLDQYQVDYCIESFHPLAVRWLKKHRPDVCRGQLQRKFSQDPHRTGPRRGFCHDSSAHQLSHHSGLHRLQPPPPPPAGPAADPAGLGRTGGKLDHPHAVGAGRM